MSESVYLVEVDINGWVPEIKREIGTVFGPTKTEIVSRPQTPKLNSKNNHGWLIRVSALNVQGAIIKAKDYLAKKINYDLGDNR